VLLATVRDQDRPETDANRGTICDHLDMVLKTYLPTRHDYSAAAPAAASADWKAKALPPSCRSFFKFSNAKWEEPLSTEEV
jgi:hypothetical protein